jgi:hypothetical protein
LTAYQLRDKGLINKEIHGLLYFTVGRIGRDRGGCGA